MKPTLQPDQNPNTAPEDLIYSFPILGTAQDANGNDVEIIVDTISTTLATLDLWDQQQDTIIASAQGTKIDNQAMREAIEALA